MNHKIGIIGNGSQAKRIKNILTDLDYYIYCTYKPNLNKLEHNIVNNFSKILECHIVFICSPTSTHFDYLKKLIGERYIFCEKPPVQTQNELDLLIKLDNGRIFYNYNMRFSKLSEVLKNTKEYKLGEILYGNNIIAHGLATKTVYKQSWRSDINTCPRGVFEIVAIHSVDLINYHFDIERIKKTGLENYSNVGSGFDTSYTTIILKNKANINIFSSYYAPSKFSWDLVFENGLIDVDSKSIIVRGPREVFSKTGFFKQPPIINNFKFNEDGDYELSVRKSVSYFLDKVASNTLFNKAHTSLSFKTNSLIV